MQMVLTRAITKEECPWLVRDLKPGEVFHYVGSFPGYTSGSDVLKHTTLFSVEEGKLPYFELPITALRARGCD